MKYLLVLQWSAQTIEDYDGMIEIETELINKLSNKCGVDGHDAGVGQMNIFIHTDDPISAFQEIKSVLGSPDFWADARVAYRELTGNKYQILWPNGLTKFTVS